jgi:hypothetical protein
VRTGDDPNPSLTALVGVLGALVLVAVVILLQAFFYWAEKGETARKTAAQAPVELARLRASQQEILGTYRWIDQPKGVAAIPIERAMALVLQEQAGPRSQSNK